MGLDLVEFTMDIEEAFGVTFSQDDAESIRTPRQLIDYLYAQVRQSDSKVCLTQRAFHRLRKAAQQELGAARSAVRPTTLWVSIVPTENRQAHWNRLHASMKVKPWPTLHRTRETVAAIGIVSFTVAAAMQLAVPTLNFLWSILASVASGTLMFYATQHRRIRFSPEAATVGRTAEFLATFAPQTLKQPDQGWTRDQIRSVVHRIIKERFNVGDFTDDSRFVEDMGLD